MTHKQFDTRKRITVYLSAEEYAAIERRANGSVSSYARKVLLAEENEQATPIPDVRPDAAIRPNVGRKPVPSSALDRLPVMGERLPAKSAARTCKHGTAQGYRCWQCGGKANVSE